MYAISYAAGIEEDLERVPTHERGRILDRLELQLRHEPARQTRNRKVLVGLVPPWQHAPPVWELRLGEYRIFYDVSETESTVIVRAIRHKPPHKTTEEIL